MRIITVNLTSPQTRALQVLQDLGMYPSRSEAIRVALRDFLQRKLGITKKLDAEETIADEDEQIEQITSKKGDITNKKVDIASKKVEIARLLTKLKSEQPEISV